MACLSGARARRTNSHLAEENALNPGNEAASFAYSSSASNSMSQATQPVDDRLTRRHVSQAAHERTETVHSRSDREAVPALAFRNISPRRPRSNGVRQGTIHLNEIAFPETEQKLTKNSLDVNNSPCFGF